MATRDAVDKQLAALDELPTREDTARRATLAKALAARHYRIAAKAARLAAEGLHYDLCGELATAYRRFVDGVPKSDPNCVAKLAALRALVELDHADAVLYLDALRYVQREPVWGGSVDTAAPIRATAAMGLVASGYPRALVEIAALLYDPEPDARAGAIRAIACGQPREAEGLLRAKLHGGDAEPPVLGECFTALLGVAPEESVELVATHLGHDDDALREHAALALGESKLEAALTRLKAAWDDPLPRPGLRRALVRGAALHRSAGAHDWLAALVAGAAARTAADVVDVLATQRHDARLTARIRAALETRGDAALLAAFSPAAV